MKILSALLILVNARFLSLWEYDHIVYFLFFSRLHEKVVILVIVVHHPSRTNPASLFDLHGSLLKKFKIYGQILFW